MEMVALPSYGHFPLLMLELAHPGLVHTLAVMTTCSLFRRGRLERTERVGKTAIRNFMLADEEVQVCLVCTSMIGSNSAPHERP